jgi:DNA replication protein DnaC
MARTAAATSNTTANAAKADGQTVRTGRQTAADLAFLARALKAPALLDAAERLAERARAESWTHTEYLVACLQREVSARDSHGGESRIRAARFPAIKTIEELDLTHLRGLTRQQLAHLGTLDFIAAKENAVFLGPPGTGKTHLATGLAVRACQAGHRVAFAPPPSGPTASPPPTTPAGSRTNWSNSAATR